MHGKSKITYFKPDKLSIEVCSKWLKMNDLLNKTVIVMTMRNTITDYRNSKTEEWANAAKYLSMNHDVTIVVIPDFYHIYDLDYYQSFAGVAIFCNEAAASIRFRSALYYNAALTMSVENKVDVFSMYNGCPNIIFKKNTKSENLSMLKLSFGESWKHFDGKLQKIVWDDDISENIIVEAESVLNKLSKKIL